MHEVYIDTVHSFEKLVINDELYIDLLHLEDLRAFYEYFTKPEYRCEYSSQSKSTYEKFQAVYDESRFMDDAKGTFYFIYSCSDKPLGCLTLRRNRRDGSYEIGFRIFRNEDRNGGIMRTVLPPFLKYLDAKEKSNKLIGRTAKENLAAIKLLENNGFHIDGETVLEINDEKLDAYVWVR